MVLGHYSTYYVFLADGCLRTCDLKIPSVFRIRPYFSHTIPWQKIWSVNTEKFSVPYTMTGILANAGITGPLPDIYDFDSHIKLPPALMLTGRTLRTRNVHNCAAKKFNEDSIDMTLDCHDNTSRTVTQDVEPPLKPLYGILQEEFKELVFSKAYCTEVGPLPLFLRKKIVREHLTNAEKSEKDKAGKEKAGKSIRGSMDSGQILT
ncbi:hypothetical protein BT96DRAFT_980519 [Gymnopus androsaceus JB14]|uniref:Uncharacterized protein n=1 Tax=Gymnopus androsaceus JB14 TaxID=1447944 RepID=A0A6A4GY47_9AGAR|nr:hypothetical protein BT96DRAFT_980519 [Gymnopus androsaceus JB14]